MKLLIVDIEGGAYNWIPIEETLKWGKSLPCAIEIPTLNTQWSYALFDFVIWRKGLSMDNPHWYEGNTNPIRYVDKARVGERPE
jgi:hypothetical protein